jgi:hypothetical protein
MDDSSSLRSGRSEPVRRRGAPATGTPEATADYLAVGHPVRRKVLAIQVPTDSHVRAAVVDVCVKRPLTGLHAGDGFILTKLPSTAVGVTPPMFWMRS